MNINATILGQVISFFLFVIICMKYIWPQILSVIEKRQKEIYENFASIENTKKDLEKFRINTNNDLKQAKKNAKEIIDLANKRKLQIIEEAKLIAKQEYKNLIKQAQDNIDFEYKLASEKLRKEVALLSIKAAEKIIKNSLDKNINKEIISKIITNL